MKEQTNTAQSRDRSLHNSPITPHHILAPAHSPWHLPMTGYMGEGYTGLCKQVAKECGRGVGLRGLVYNSFLSLHLCLILG